MKPIVDFEIVDHGIDNCQFFQGCGVNFTEYTDVATGIGMDFAEAIDDCLENLAQMDYETADMDKRILDMVRKCYGKCSLPKRPAVTSKYNEDCYYYVSIRVK